MRVPRVDPAALPLVPMVLTATLALGAVVAAIGNRNCSRTSADSGRFACWEAPSAEDAGKVGCVARDKVVYLKSTTVTVTDAFGNESEIQATEIGTVDDDETEVPGTVDEVRRMLE